MSELSGLPGSEGYGLLLALHTRIYVVQFSRCGLSDPFKIRSKYSNFRSDSDGIGLDSRCLI